MGPSLALDVAALAAFVLDRQQGAGGFSTVPSLPATVEDTFYAIEILLRLEPLVPHLHLRSQVNLESLSRFVQERYAEEQSRLPLRLCYFLHKIQLNFPGMAIPWRGFPALQPTKFEHFFYLQQLGRRERKKNDCFLPPLNLKEVSCKEVYFYLALFAVSSDVPRQALIRWLRDCQNGDGGFGFFPGSTSFLENCFYCLAALALLGAKPSALQQAREFVLSCQTGVGGFARSLIGAPFLESTWYGVELVCGPLSDLS